MKRLIVLLFALALTGATSAGEWHIETVDSEGWAGYSTSLALDSSGYPHISYYDYTKRDLKYARWNGSSWQLETVDSVGGYGGVSLALDSSDYPHISYYEPYPNDDLKYAHWNGSSWQIETVDSTGDVGQWSSVALDSSDYPHISYYDRTNDDLKYARWNGSSWQIETVDSTGDLGQFTSLALDDSDYPHISYSDWDYYNLKYARWDGSSWQIETVDSEGISCYYTSLALDSSDRPHISYYEWVSENLKYARWNGSSWQIYTVDSAGNVGSFTSLALDSSGNPHISYYDVSNTSLKYAYWEGGPGVENVELSANIRDEGVLVGWVITGDTPAGLRVLRSVEEGEPVAIHDNPLPGSATCYLDRLDKGFCQRHSSLRSVQPLVQPLAGMEYRYWLEVTDADGMTSRFGPTEPVSIPGQISRLALGEPYPSPARDTVNLSYELPNGCSGAVIEVYDLSGRRLDSFSLAPQPDRGEVFLDVSDYASGVYTARLSMDEGSVSRRLVVAR